jgi:predicted O-methyltransferase YrrM
MKNIILDNLQTNFWFNYPNFYTEVSQKDYKIFVEVGVWKGHSISYLAKKLKESKKDFKVYAVDLFENTSKEDWGYLKEVPYIYEIYNEVLKREGVRDVITDIKGCSWDMASKFEDHSIDFVFIDAGHDYESVSKDIKNWLPKIKPGGMISGHDFYNSSGVAQAVKELVPDFKISSEKIWFKQI